jgi:hypothetical protein
VTLLAKTPEAFLNYLLLIHPKQWFPSSREGGRSLTDDPDWGNDCSPAAKCL